MVTAQHGTDTCQSRVARAFQSWHIHLGIDLHRPEFQDVEHASTQSLTFLLIKDVTPASDKENDAQQDH